MADGFSVEVGTLLSAGPNAIRPDSKLFAKTGSVWLQPLRAGRKKISDAIATARANLRIMIRLLLLFR